MSVDGAPTTKPSTKSAEAPQSGHSDGKGHSDDGSPEAARRAAAIARQTMSPFCPGRTLADCPSPNAAEWRSDIRDMVDRGMSAAEIQDALEARTGGNLSGSPGREVSYAVPIGFGLLAFGVLGAVLLRLRRARAPVGTADAASEGTTPAGRPRGEAAGAALGTNAALADDSLIDDARLDDELRRAEASPDDD